MSNISKLEFPALNISGENYMSWTANVKRHLRSMGVLNAIQEFSDCEEQDKAKADVFIHKHIDELLQQEYFNCQDPCVIWKDLKDRFDHQKEVLLPTARDEWNNLRFQDFKRVNDYTSALYKICSMLEFCGHYVSEEDKLEKTYSTFHASNINLQTQYRWLKFKSYSDLNAFLLIAEKNHQSRPTGSLAIPEANIAHNNDHKNSGPKWEQGRGRGHGLGLGHFEKRHFNGLSHSFKRKTNSYGRGRCRGRGRNQRANNYRVPQYNNSNQQNKFKNEANTSQSHGTPCFRCGSSNHRAKTCRTPPHLCKLYQASLKEKETEVNHVNTFDNVNTKLNNSDFCGDLEI